MRPSFIRYLALGVLVVGLAAIAWTALRGDDPGDDSAANLSADDSAANLSADDSAANLSRLRLRRQPLRLRLGRCRS